MLVNVLRMILILKVVNDQSINNLPHIMLEFDQREKKTPLWMTTQTIYTHRAYCLQSLMSLYYSIFHCVHHHNLLSQQTLAQEDSSCK